MYKILALDLDGTLFTSRRWVSSNTKQVIRKAVGKGIYVTIATGRPYYIAKEVAKELNINIPLVAHDGAYVSDGKGEPIFEKRLNCLVSQELASILIENGVEFDILHQDFSITNRSIGLNDLLKLLAFKVSKVEKRYRKVIPEKKIVKHIANNNITTPKMFAYIEKGDWKKAIVKIEERLGNEVRVLQSNYGLEILPKGISKTSGLQRLIEALGIEKEEVIAVGDSYNDLEMLQFAGLGVAMGNAPEDVKKYAKYITKTNDQEGIPHVVDKFLFKSKAKA